MDLTNELAIALGVPEEEAAREVEDMEQTGVLNLQGQVCPCCSYPMWDHLPDDVQKNNTGKIVKCKWQN